MKRSLDATVAENDEERRPVREALFVRENRRRPTLPGHLYPSTIGAERLNFRVRDGNGCDPAAIATEIYLSRMGPRILRSSGALRALQSKHERL